MYHVQIDEILTTFSSFITIKHQLTESLPGYSPHWLLVADNSRVWDAGGMEWVGMGDNVWGKPGKDEKDKLCASRLLVMHC